VLPYNAFERGGSVLSCRNDISVVFHIYAQITHKDTKKI
jgi:hypothetical protein